mgnify:CR=1 FL=1
MGRQRGGGRTLDVERGEADHNGDGTPENRTALPMACGVATGARLTDIPAGATAVQTTPPASFESFVFGDSQAEFASIADAIEKTHDEASAHEAALVIQSVNGELDTLNKQMENKSDAEKTALIMARNGEWIQAQQRVSVSMMKLATADAKIMQMISTEMDKTPKLEPK